MIDLSPRLESTTTNSVSQFLHKLWVVGTRIVVFISVSLKMRGFWKVDSRETKVKSQSHYQPLRKAVIRRRLSRLPPQSTDQFSSNYQLVRLPPNQITIGSKNGATFGGLCAIQFLWKISFFDFWFSFGEKSRKGKYWFRLEKREVMKLRRNCVWSLFNFFLRSK